MLYDGNKNSSMDYCDSEQGTKSTEYDFLHRTFSKYVFLKHVSKSIVRYVKTIFTKLERLDYILAILLKVSIEKSLTQTELSELFQTMIFPFYRL